MQAGAIEVRDLVTHYGTRLILDGVDMDVAPGEIMVIMGVAARVRARSCGIC